MRARPAASRSGTTSSSSSTRTRTARSRRSRQSMSTPAWASSASPAYSRRRRASRTSRASPRTMTPPVFAPSLRAIASLSGKAYARTVPTAAPALRPGADRHRLPRPCRPRPVRLLRHRRRDPPGQRGAQLCHPPHPPTRGPVRPQPRPRARVLRAAGAGGPGIPGRRLPRIAPPGVHAAARRPLRGGELRPHSGAGPEALRRGRGPWQTRRPGRLRALRHVRVPGRPDPGHRSSSAAFRSTWRASRS